MMLHEDSWSRFVRTDDKENNIYYGFITISDKKSNNVINYATVTVSSQTSVCFIVSQSYSRDIVTLDNMLEGLIKP